MSDAPDLSRNDRAWLCRETIAESMGFIIVSAEIIQRYCQIADEAGVHYQLNRMAAHFRGAASVYRDLAAVRNEGIGDEGDARGAE
jgi:hypothetical protein